MSLHNFKGEIEYISERHLEFISEMLNKYGFFEQQVKVSNVGNPGDNYGSYVKRLTVESENGKVFKVIGKIAPEVQLLTAGEKPVNDYFNNEITIYDEFLPKLVSLQEAVGISEKDRLRHPLCYGALLEPKNELILLEDLDVRNYVMLDKRQPLTNRAVKIILQNLANYHSMSYVLRYKKPEDYERIVKTLINIITNTEALRLNETFIKETMNDMASMFNDKKYINIINDIKEQFVDNIIDLLSIDQDSKYNVILHGDLWTNNIMFQIKDNQLEECMMIDYQQVRKGVPAVDIHNLILCCTDYETRSKHYNEWIDCYYSELERYLNNFGLKANSVYPRDILNDDLTRYSKMCLSISLIMINFMLRQSEESPDITIFDANRDVKNKFDGFTVQNLKKNTAEKIKNRIEGLIDSCLEYKYVTEKSDSSN